MEKLLTRDIFRNNCLVRDGNKCVICGSTELLSVHHIVERKIFSDGGYFMSNGATLCENHHIAAEQTILTCEEIREACGITKIILPSHLYEGERYDKWANLYLANGNRVKGELFDDISVQKILPDFVKSEFTDYIKYPRTLHLPWSLGISEDDRIMTSANCFEGKEIVVSVKLDGENSSFYGDYFHARSIDSDNDLSRNWVKNLLFKKAWELPKGFRICGENMFAKHSIYYDNLKTYFFIFSIWNDKNECLSWDETKTWAELLDLELVPVLYEGIYDEEKIKSLYHPNFNGCEMEGYVVRLRDSFHYSKFKTSCGKMVRESHVKTNEHWKRTWTPNKLAVV